MFDALIADREAERTESRRFEAQKWEVDLAKGFELPVGTPVQRRSALFRIPDFKFPLVRVDRIYRMDRRKIGNSGNGNNMSPGKAAADVGVVKKAAVGAEVFDAAGGELIWDNAMVADHLMLQVQKGITRKELEKTLPAACKIRGVIDSEKGLYLVAVPSEGDRAIERAVMALNHESLKKTIKFAEPDFLIGGADTTPDDPLFTTSLTDTSKQWHLPRIMAPRAWDVVKKPAQVGSISASTIESRTVVAVVDTGVDYTHPDLVPNLYINPGESGGGKETNNNDDDGNGKVDDYRGWNFVDNTNDPMDDMGHGTHVAGIIGSAGNNIMGTTGVCWGVKMIPLRIIKKLGLGSFGAYSDAVAAMSYMRTLNSPMQRIRVANHSWGGNGFSLAMLNALNNPLASADPLPTGLTATYARDVNVLTLGGSSTERAKVKIGMTACSDALPENTRVTIINGTSVTLSNYTTLAGTNAVIEFINPELPKQYGVVHVAAAGNSRFNLDRIPTYPASLPSSFVISVAASDVNDNPAVWSGTAGSNFGKLTADLFAPGSSIWSTRWKQPGDPDYGYESRNGTSMAAPQVAGAVALLRMWQPTMTDVQARQILIDQVEPLAALKDKCISGGRLNVARMVDKVYTPALLASGGSTGGTGTSSFPLSGASGTSGLIASGNGFTLTVRNGKVYAWGNNDYYRVLGATTPSFSTTPLEVPGLDNVVMVAAGGVTCFAVKTDGSVWVWGLNDNGLFGNNTFNPYPGVATPAQITALNEITWISAGSSHALAVRADGTVWAWGRNSGGKLGDGTTNDRFTPVQVSGLSGIIMVAAGSNHSLALDIDGYIHCWGARGTTSYNPLGDGAATSYSLTPFRLASLTNVSFIDASSNSSLALRSDGTIWQWGFSNGGIQSTEPSQRTGLTNIILAELSQQEGWALDSDGRMFAWGAGSRGGLGNASFTSINSFSETVNSRSPIVGLAGYSDNCSFRTLDGEVYSAGWNERGRLGNGVAPVKYYPVLLSSLYGASSIAFGRPRSGQVGGFAVNVSGSRLRWGDPVSNDEEGNPEGARTLATPREMTFMAGATKIGMYDDVYLYTKLDGTLWGWGAGSSGQLGIGTTPFDVPVASPVQIPVGGTVVDFSSRLVSPSSSAGTYYFSAALLSTGVIKTWGNNSLGQLGDGTNISRPSPVTVTGLTGVTKIATGSGHMLALRADKTVWSWGDNLKGQLGDGSTTSRNAPGQVAPLDLYNVVAIAAVGQASFAVRQDGTVWAWGERGEYPRLGFASGSGDVKTPTQVTVAGFPAIKAISAGPRCVLVTDTNNTVWAWGDPAHLGRGPVSASVGMTPGQVVGLSDVVEIIAASPACYARKADGTVFAWGSSVGDGNDMTNVPVPVLGFGGASDLLSSLGTQNAAASWQFQNFSVPELLSDEIVADDSDPDGDGISNLLEYALGLDPKSQSRQGLPTMRVDLIAPKAQSESSGVSQISLFDVSGCCGSMATAELLAGKNYPALTVNRAGGIRQDINYWIEVSEDLQLWRTGDPYTVTVLDTAETLEVYSATPTDVAPRQFMRLKVQRK